MRRSLINGKKGGDKMISLYWFVILTLIAGGVILMANAFYGKPYDVRGLESEILAAKAADCVYSGGMLNEELISPQGTFKASFRDSFLEKCSLNFEREKEFQEEQYYVRVDFFKEEDSEKSEFFLEGGNKNYVHECNIEEGFENLPVCFESSFWVSSSGSNIKFVKVLSIVSKTKENVK